MELNIKEPRDREQLREITKNMGWCLVDSSTDISIRVENNIFSIDGKWLLKTTKGNTEGNLENIQVLVDSDEDRTNFRSEVRKMTENFDGRMDVDIKKLLYTRLDMPNVTKDKPCLTLSYLSILETGNSADIEAWKKEGFTWQDIKTVDRTQLTPSTSYTYGVIRQNEQEIENLLKKYREFDEKKFDQYFLHGMENRYDLLEGIMYYTNRDLTNKYLELANGEFFPTKEEKIEIWKRETAKIYEQLYRFIYVLDGEDGRFDYSLRTEEKEEINEMIEEILQRLQGKDQNEDEENSESQNKENQNKENQNEENQDEKGVLLFFKRGIFFYDKCTDEARVKGLTYDKVRGYTWTGEVYKVLQQLEFMERIDGYQYYKRWLQAKIGRLKTSNQYPEEKISKLEEIYENFFNRKPKIEEKDVEKS